MAEGKNQAAQLKRAPHLRVIEQAFDVKAMADEDLMLAHGKGNEAAFQELVCRHQRGVLNYMFRMLQNRHIAEELTQEVFLALVKNGDRYQPTAKFTTYLYAIASNMVSKEWLRRKRRPKLLSLFASWGSDDDNAYDPIDHTPDEKADTLTVLKNGEVARAVNKALQHLPEHQREAFVLRRFRDLSYEEIAEITDVPIGTAKSRVVRAERALRPHLESFRDYVG